MRQQPRYQPGDKIGGRYQVYQVRMGGMGEVYLCLDLEEMIPYALKTFQQRYQTKSLRPAFEQEVATWVTLERHPNIVRCYWMQELDNQPFMCLDWIAGEEGKGSDLRGWLRHGPLNLQLALEITLDIVYGLLHAQQKQPGIVHRDLKPENILMAQGGLAKITDFGLAQIVASETKAVESAWLADQLGRQQSLVQHGHIVGTPAYMPPEQWRGEPLDERSDIYALGCILYEVVTGQQPFMASFIPTTPQQYNRWLSAIQSQHETSPLPMQANGLPTNLANLIQNCLAKKLANRPPTLRHLQEQLTQVYQQQIAQAPPKRPAPAVFTATDYNSRGVTYWNLKLYERALDDLNRAIEIDSKYANAYVTRGNIYHALGWHELSLTDLNYAIELDATLGLAYYNRGNIYVTLNQGESALADFNQAIKLNPKHVSAYVNRGSIHKQLQQPQQALADFTRATELDPQAGQAYLGRGLLYEQLQQPQQALADFTHAIKLDPEASHLYFRRGLLYEQLQQHEQAIADFTCTIELDPQLALAYFTRGNAYAVLQQHEQALANYSQAIKLGLELAEVYYNRGLTYHELQQHRQAVADFTHFIEINANDATAYNNRGLTYIALQQHKLALVDFDHAIELDPQLAIAYVNRGAIYQQLQRHQQSLADFSQAIILNPTDAAIYNYRGVTYGILKLYHQALADFKQAIILNPKFVDSYSNRGMTYVALQQHELALVDFTQAIELDPEYVIAYLNMGTLLMQIGKPQQAQYYFEQATRLGHPPTQAIPQEARDLNQPSRRSQTDSVQAAFAAFQKAATLTEMRQAVANHPPLTQPDFIVAIEQAITQQIPPSKQPPFKQRLAWLQQLAQAQS